MVKVSGGTEIAESQMYGSALLGGGGAAMVLSLFEDPLGALGAWSWLPLRVAFALSGLPASKAIDSYSVALDKMTPWYD
jgi:hypothetical protein